MLSLDDCCYSMLFHVVAPCCSMLFPLPHVDAVSWSIALEDECIHYYGFSLFIAILYFK